MSANSLMIAVKLSEKATILSPNRILLRYHRSRNADFHLSILNAFELSAIYPLLCPKGSPSSIYIIQFCHCKKSRPEPPSLKFFWCVLLTVSLDALAQMDPAHKPLFGGINGEGYSHAKGVIMSSFVLRRMFISRH